MAVAVQDIVHAFLQAYYQRMRKDPSKVSCLYSPTAELTHINYQVDFDCTADSLSTIKLTGKENISRFFTRNNKKVSDLKAKIDTCDFQTAGISHSSILILTTGEMYWSGTPAYRFCQTIILQPNADNKDAFDVTNDVIRFIPDNLKPHMLKPSKGLKENGKEPEQFVTNGGLKEQKAENKEAKLEHKTKVEESAINEKPKAPESSPADEVPINVPEVVEDMDSKEIKSIEVRKTDTSDETEKPVEIESEEQIAAHDSKADSPEPDEESKPAAPPVRMSWASKLAASSDTFKTTTSVANNESPKTESTQPTSNKKIHETKHDIQTTQRDSNNARATKKKPQFSTVNKDGFYPIYIKGTAGIKEEKLRSALETEFGTIMKMTTADSFAVVDFESQKSQMDALEKKQLTVGDTEVYLGRKTVKKSSSTPPVGSSGSIRSHKKHSNKKRD